MPALRRVAAILAVASTLVFASAVAEARNPSPMVTKINDVRKAYGLSPMRYSRSLSRSSSRFVHYLARTQQFAHSSRILASGRFSQLGEVLALTRGWQVRRTLALAYWLQSWSHRAVILNPSFRYIGAARAGGHFAGSPMLFWTVQVGR